MKFILLALMPLPFGVNAETLRKMQEKDVMPAKYCKYGITSIADPISSKGVQ